MIHTLDCGRFGFGFAAPYLVIEVDGSEGTEPYQFAAVAGGPTLDLGERYPNG